MNGSKSDGICSSRTTNHQKKHGTTMSTNTSTSNISSTGTSSTKPSHHRRTTNNNNNNNRFIILHSWNGWTTFTIGIIFGCTLCTLFQLSIHFPKLSLVIKDVTNEYNNNNYIINSITSSSTDDEEYDNGGGGGDDFSDVAMKVTDNNNNNNQQTCTPESFASKYNPLYSTYNPRNNNRTLLIILSTTIPNNEKDILQRKIRQSVLDNVLLSESDSVSSSASSTTSKTTTNIDVAVMYYYTSSDMLSLTNQKSSKPDYIETKWLSKYYQGRIKYIWPINVTDYINDWGIAIDEIVLRQQQQQQQEQDIAHGTIKDWRNRILPHLRQDDTFGNNIFGGVTPCYYRQSKFSLNQQCYGNGLSQLLLYHYLQDKLLEVMSTSTDETETQSQNSNLRGRRIIDFYDRFIVTHSDIYHLCTHPNVVGGVSTSSPISSSAVGTNNYNNNNNNNNEYSYLDPRYIWTPSATITPSINTRSADELGIPLTHWIVSYQHILYGGVLNIVPNLLQNYALYVNEANLASMNVQRLVRTVWQYQCLLPLHRRFPRTLLSTNTVTKTKTNFIPSIGIYWKYQYEYDCSSTVCMNQKYVTTTNSSLSLPSNPPPNEATFTALATADSPNASFIYPLLCLSPNDDDNEDNDDDNKSYSNNDSKNKAQADTNSDSPNDDENDNVGDDGEGEDEDEGEGDDKINNIRTLVIIMGNLRGGELAWNSLYKNVLDFNNADLALLIGDTQEMFKNSTMFERAKYHWTLSEYDDWYIPLSELINNTILPTNPTFDVQKDILDRINYREGLFGGLKGYKGSGGIIMIIRYFLQKKIRELDLRSKYERFVITRSDHYYLCAHDLSQLSLEYLWTPNGGSDYYGVTDRHLVVSNKLVLQALDIFPTLFRNPIPFIGLKVETMNPERLIKYAWHIHRPECLLSKHKQFPRVMFTCGTDGDKTRWKELGRKVKEGVRLKYANEYYSSQATCEAQMKMKSTSL